MEILTMTIYIYCFNEEIKYLKFEEGKMQQIKNQYTECEIHFTFFGGIIYPSKKKGFSKRSFRETEFNFNQTTNSCSFSYHFYSV